MIRKALETGRNENFEVDELPGLNQLFQLAKIGGISEYSEIEETMSRVAMEKVASWILENAGKSQSNGPIYEYEQIAPLKQIADHGTYGKSLSF